MKVDWSHRDNKLFCSIFTNYRANACSACGSTLHLSAYCPTLLDDSQPRPFPAGGNVNRYNLTGGNQLARSNTNNDVLGRSRVVHNGQEICNNFNTARGCPMQRCRNAHICLTCKQMDHAKINCQNSKNLQGQRIQSLR